LFYDRLSVNNGRDRELVEWHLGLQGKKLDHGLFSRIGENIVYNNPKQSNLDLLCDIFRREVAEFRRIVNETVRFVKVDSVDGIVESSEIMIVDNFCNPFTHPQHFVGGFEGGYGFTYDDEGNMRRVHSREKVSNEDERQIKEIAFNRYKEMVIPTTRIKLKTGDDSTYVILTGEVQLSLRDKVVLYLGFLEDVNYSIVPLIPATKYHDVKLAHSIVLPDRMFRAKYCRDPGFFWSSSVENPKPTQIDDLKDFDVSGYVSRYIVPRIKLD